MQGVIQGRGMDEIHKSISDRRSWLPRTSNYAADESRQQLFSGRSFDFCPRRNYSSRRKLWKEACQIVDVIG